MQGSRWVAFRARLGKLALLARSRVSSARLLRTGGAASFTYGDDVTGVSADALLQRRRMVASAVAPPTGGRDLDLALLLADTNGYQRLDPAFDASTLPMSRWAEAVYSQWCPLPLLTASIARARLRVLLAWRPWAVVCGPAAATVATAQRLGWEVRDAATFVTDQGRVLDLRADPPVVVRKEVQAAVGRWRLKTIVQRFPHLDQNNSAHPAQPALVGVLQSASAIAVAPIRKLLSVASRTKQWTAAHQAALWSAVVGTQWSQCRLFTAGMGDRPDCQLCAAASIAHPDANPSSIAAEPPRGTLWHRLTTCRPTLDSLTATAPSLADGFVGVRNRLRMRIGHPPDDTSTTLSPPSPASSPSAVIDTPTPPLWGPPHRHTDAWKAEVLQLDRRHEIEHAAHEAAWFSASAAAAATRALVPLPQVAPAVVPPDGTFAWRGQAPSSSLTATFYTDGSLIDREYDGCARLGWAFVAVDTRGNHIGAASGVAPSWIDSISGAEAWALLMAARAAAPGSNYVTDSLTCVGSYRKGARWALAPDRPLARVWKLLFETLGRTASPAAEQPRITWMPSHTTVASVGAVRKSDDTWLTHTDRNANAVADALANAAAHGARVPVATRAAIAATYSVTYLVAQFLGRATFAANHHPSPPYRDSAPTALPRPRTHGPPPLVDGLLRQQNAPGNKAVTLLPSAAKFGLAGSVGQRPLAEPSLHTADVLGLPQSAGRKGNGYSEWPASPTGRGTFVS